MFGSAARGEARPDSDVDILVEFRPDAEVGFIEYGGLMLALSELLGRKVDLVSKPALKPPEIAEKAMPAVGQAVVLFGKALLAGLPSDDRASPSRQDPP